VIDTGWAEVVARSRQAIGDEPGAVRRWSVTHARALAAGAALYRDQRERGSSADRDALVAAAAASSDQVLSTAAGPVARNGIDPEVVGELGDRSLDGLAVLARGSLGELAVESLLAAGSLPRPRDAAASGLVLGPDGWQLAFTREDGEDLAAWVVVADSAGPIRAVLDESTGPRVVYASSDALGDLPDAITVVGPEVAEFDVGGPTVVDIGLRAAEIDEALLARPHQESLDVGRHVVDAVPVFALGLIAARAARRALTTDDPGTAIRDDTLSDTSDVFVNRGVGQLAAIVTGAKLIVAPVAISTSLARSISRRSSSSVEGSRRVVAGARQEIARISAWYGRNG
jgi:hypothetical protein